MTNKKIAKKTITFDAAGTAVFRCDNPAGNPLFVTNAKLTAIPFADLENVAAP